ncbi:RHS repeat protein [Endozoicomonas sp. SM1973]|uniref:RHS repeat protein n=1 Tax=Spartinivicinus marinus TaxID=2994442 RepID=A0A853ICW3_9GAMM|nr:RHS repeat protein [Spartinivicinus marinus]MCX4026230.1 hypothetical protein [Spartinivicinus marinus]NYZ67357.1 RHS repeat protein [Spartinivicinus marinus]
MNNLFSNAFNLSQYLSGKVDPRTGQFHFSINLLSYLGNTLNGPIIDLVISYNSLSQSNQGYGKGWLINLPYYDSANKKIYLSSGQAYQIESQRSSSESQLKYCKLKAFKVDTSNDKKIKILQKDGTTEQLNQDGFLEKITAPDGRELIITYQTPTRKGLIQTISDGSDRALSVSYNNSKVVFTGADNRKIELFLTRSELRRIQWPDGTSSSIEYDTINSCRVIKRITHPTGKTEVLNYYRNKLKIPNGGPIRAIPAVQSHRLYGAGIEDVIKQYDYSVNNFLGYKAGARFKANLDNLYERQHDYRYTSTERDNQRKIVKTYNKFHLLVDEEVFDLDSNKRIAKRAFDYYADVNTIFSDQPDQYQLLKKMDLTFYNASGGSRVETNEWEYDIYGNLLSETDAYGVTTRYSYYHPAGEENCPASPSGLPFLQKNKAKSPSSRYASGDEQCLVENYTYRSHPSLIEGKTYPVLATRTLSNELGSTPVSSWDTTYFNTPSQAHQHGKVKQATESVANNQTVTSYTYTLLDAELQTHQTTALKNDLSFSESWYESLMTGEKTKEVDSFGVVNRYEYDAQGRVVKEVIAEGTTFEQTKDSTYTTSPQNTLEVVSTSGSNLKYKYDVLGREIEKYQTDTKGALSLIEKRSYDLASRLSSLTIVNTDKDEEVIETTTEYTYDLWDEVKQITQPSGLKLCIENDKVANKTKEYRQNTSGNRSYQIETYYNELGKATTVKIYSPAGELYSDAEKKYDGLGLLVEEKDVNGITITYRYDNAGRVITENRAGNVLRVEKSYDRDSLESWLTQIKVNNQTIGTRSYDGMGRLLTETKFNQEPTTYRYDTLSEKPSEVTLPNGKKVTYELESILNEVKAIKPSDVSQATQYTYYATTSLVHQIINPSVELTIEYFPNGLVKAETRGEYRCHYEYSRQNNLLKVTDFFGNEETHEYDAYGRENKVTNNTANESIEISYDGFDRVEKEVVSNTAGQIIEHAYYYDDYDRLQQKISIMAGIQQCNQSFEYYKDNKLKKKTTIDFQRNTTTEEYQYNELNRLSFMKAQGPLSPKYINEKTIKQQVFEYNPLGDITNVSTEFIDGENTETDIVTYQYGDENTAQLITINHSHSSIESIENLQYDANGNLTCDLEGRIYIYNALNQLTVVEDQADTSLSEYQYDGVGQQISQSVPNQAAIDLFYSGSQLINEKQGDIHSQYLRSGSSLTTRYTKQNDNVQRTQLITDFKGSVIGEISGNEKQLLRYSAYGLEKH